jgi:hypothetical protein
MNPFLTPAELLDRIHASGGDISLQPDGSLTCRDIPCELVPEVRRHASNFVLQAILSGFCDQPVPEHVAPKKPKGTGRGRKRSGCVICKTGKGCRVRGIRTWQPCPECGHGCAFHYLEEMHALADGGLLYSPAGCRFYEGCDCCGFPIPEKKTKVKNLELPFEVAL